MTSMLVPYVRDRASTFIAGEVRIVIASHTIMQLLLRAMIATSDPGLLDRFVSISGFHR